MWLTAENVIISAPADYLNFQFIIIKLNKKMKFKILLILICIQLGVLAQNTDSMLKGSVSFISSQNIYVQFVNTSGIQTGDTLFLLNTDKFEPALLVTSLSSISCIGYTLDKKVLTPGNTLYARKKTEIPLEVSVEKSQEALSVNDLAINTKKQNDSTVTEKPDFYGRLSVSSYNNFSSDPLSISTPNYRLKYNLSINANHIGNTGLSFENYMSYTHTLNNPNENYKDLRVYNLALNYEFGKTALLSLGRKINVNTANIGAVDGLQFEKKIYDFTAGALVGTRPNDVNYSFDPALFQYGAFVSHQINRKNGLMQSSVAFFNQTNNKKTDRRYIYVQHCNSLLKNVDFFGSAEIDLYAIENNVPVNDFDLTSIYLSLNYHPFQNLSLAMSFDARRNVYYFETYKSRIDSLLEKEMRQGLRFHFNYRPFRFLTWGGIAGYRLNTPASHESKYATSYLAISKIPGIDASFTLTGTALQTTNLFGYIAGAAISRDFMDGKLNGEIEYRKDLIFSQDIADLSLSWRLSRKLMLSADFETTFENSHLTERVFINLTQRF